MKQRHPMVSITSNALVIKIPWSTIDISQPDSTGRKKRLTPRDVLEIVESGRLAHRIGKTRSVRSLKEFAS